MPSKNDQSLTKKQQTFVDSYDGNASKAAEIAGYSCPGVEGNRLLKNAKVARAIREKERNQINPHIKSRVQRQKFWSDMMDSAKDNKSKLKASELLARSEGDFLDRVEHSGGIDVLHDLISNVAMRFVPYADREDKAEDNDGPEP